MSKSVTPKQLPLRLPTLPGRSLLVLLWCIAVTSHVANAQNRSVSARPSGAMISEGFTEPKYVILVAATEIGRLEAITVEAGDHVHAGQVIGQLEDSLQASSVEIAKLQAEMTGEWEATRAEADLHRARTEKLRELAAAGMARPDELSRAETDLRIAMARHASAEEQLQLRRLELKRYELQLERRKIRVPMAGVVATVFHQPGEYITPGDPAVIRLLVMDKLFAVFNVPVEETVIMTVGAPVRVYLRSSSTTLVAAITSIAPDIDGESGTVQVRVELDNADGSLLAGDRCTLQLSSETGVGTPSAASIPTRGAIQR